MAFNFKKHTLISGSNAPKMTIRKGGSLGINQAAARRFGIDSDDYYAILYYDDENNAIGIEITRDENAEGALKIQYRPYKKDNKNVIIQVSIKSLLDRHAIDYSESSSYVPFKDEETGLIVLDLNKPKAKRSGKPAKQTETAPPQPSQTPNTASNPHPPAPPLGQISNPPPAQPAPPADQQTPWDPNDTSTPF
jgi:hypothetical protein